MSEWNKRCPACGSSDIMEEHPEIDDMSMCIECYSTWPTDTKDRPGVLAEVEKKMEYCSKTKCETCMQDFESRCQLKEIKKEWMGND